MEKLQHTQQLIRGILKCINENGGDKCLSSIILTGSFGREEATYVMDEQGELRLKSDVEIALVYSKKSKKKEVKTLIDAVSRSFTEELNLMPISQKRVCKVQNYNATILVPHYKTLFTYDLFNGSKTIWGKQFIEGKTVSINQVDPYEAKRLIANRIGEAAYIESTCAGSDYENTCRQWKGKIVLAIGSAWLICKKQYVSSYREQYHILRNVKNEIEADVGIGFFAEYERAFLFLRDNGVTYEIPNERLKLHVRQINERLNEWEVRLPRTNSMSRCIKNYWRYIKCGIPYSFFNYENKILQKLIDSYVNENGSLGQVATVWKKVLY